MLERLCREGNLSTLLMGMQGGAATVENRMKVFKKLKQSHHVIQQFHSWAYLQRRPYFEKIYAS